RVFRSASSTGFPDIRQPESCSGSSRFGHRLANVRFMALSKADREVFLSQPHIAALSVNAGDDRGPRTVPIWYQYAPGGEPWILTGANSRKARLIETAGRFSLMVERLEPTVRYVAVDGPVSRIEPGGDELLVEIT